MTNIGIDTRSILATPRVTVPAMTARDRVAVMVNRARRGDANATAWLATYRAHAWKGE